MSERTDRPRVVVVGSANMDLAVRCDRLPAPGETVLGGRFASGGGGKGANQAVAAARLGASSHFVGRIGNDPFGAQLKALMDAAGVHTDSLIVTEGEHTGVAVIVVDRGGENSIVVASGANAQVSPADVEAAEPLIASADVLLVQLELPVETVIRAIEVARARRVKVVLDPAPAPGALPPRACDVDVINPNQTEAFQLTGERIGEDGHSAKLVAAALIRLGARAAVIKLGRRGAVAVEESGELHEVPAFEVPVVDTTAAGDAFAAALAVATGQGRPLAEAAAFACAAGALACTRLGAISAMPALADVQDLLQSAP